MTAMEGAVIERHWQHLQALFAAGRVNVVGRCENGASGLVVFEAPSFADARAVRQADPVVAAGLMDAELHDFRLLLVRPPGK